MKKYSKEATLNLSQEKETQQLSTKMQAPSMK